MDLKVRSTSPLVMPILSSPQSTSVEHGTQTLSEFVKSKQGKSSIKRVLIANNGIAAVKAMRSMRKFAYDTFGNDREIAFIAMATPEDIKANAEYIRLADQCVTVPGGSNNNNYANVMLITEVAERCGADAVWAGWGHASENPKLPDMLAKTKSGVIWIGPSSSAMRALGDKIGSTLIAQSAGVNCMPWSGDGLIVDYKNSGIPKDAYSKSCVTTSDEAVEVCQRIGFPCMIKASEGGGGKGIRKVEKADEVPLAYQQVQGELPGSPIFIMKLAPACRHLEVQLLGDMHGNAIAIAGRDCSIQRRHQKIIEEGPVLAAPLDTWRKMENAAVALAKEVGYIGAGTVEYLFTTTGEYYFLELNPRLQVEHPVTEGVSGVNLPAAQLQVAMGLPLHCIADIRRLYGKNPNGTSKIDFENEQQILIPVHVIACRITAENPDASFQPTSGVIKELNFRSTPSVWGYFSVSSNGGVHEYSDSQFGHLFSTGSTREHARANMVLALKELSIRGDIRTTVEYLRMILEHRDFIYNLVGTTWLERVMADDDISMEKPDSHLTVLLGAIFRAYHYSFGKLTEYMNILKRGAMPSAQLHQELISVVTELIYNQIKYRFKVTKSGENSFDVTLLSHGTDQSVWTATADVLKLSDEGLLVNMDGHKYVVYGQEFPQGLRLVVDGKTCLFQKEYDPTTLKSSMAGKLVRYIVEDGVHIEKGAPYAEVEVMKMYLSLLAPESGFIHLCNVEGAIIEAGVILATLDLDFPDKVERADLFTGTFPSMGPASLLGNRINILLKDSLEKLRRLLSGYKLGTGVADSSLSKVVSYLRDPSLPSHEFQSIFSTLSGRIPEPLFDELQSICTEYQENMLENRFYWESPQEFPVSSMQNAIDNECLKLNDKEIKALNTTLETAGFTEFLTHYGKGNHIYAAYVLKTLLEEYYQVEQYFSENPYLAPEDVIKNLRTSTDVETVARVARANHQLKERSMLIVNILDTVMSHLKPMMKEFLDISHLLSNLVGQKEYAGVVLKSRQLIMTHDIPSSQQREISILTFLTSAAETKEQSKRLARLAPLVDQAQPIEDMIFSFFENENHSIRATAFETYVRRMYHTYTIKSLNVEFVNEKNIVSVEWTFFLDPSCMNVDLLRHTQYEAVIDADDVCVEKQLSSSDDNNNKNDPPAKKKMNRVISLAELSSLESNNTPLLPKSNVFNGTTIDEDSPGFSSNRRSLTREGVFLYFKDGYSSLKKELGSILSEVFHKNNINNDNDNDDIKESSSSSNDNIQLNVLYLAISWYDKLPSDEQLSSYFLTLLKANEESLYSNDIRRVTFVVSTKSHTYPLYFTFRSKIDYQEDSIIRHIEPSYALYLEVHKLANFNIQFVPTTYRTVHLFSATPIEKWVSSSKRDKYDGKRLFARTLVRNVDSIDSRDANIFDLEFDAHPEIEQAFVESLNSLEMAIACRYNEYRYNHIFVNILVPSSMQIAYVKSAIRLLTRRYSEKIRRLNVSGLELYCRFENSMKNIQLYRFVCTNPTSSILFIDVYEEVNGNDGAKVLKHVVDKHDLSKGIDYNDLVSTYRNYYWDSKSIFTPYRTTEPFRIQREIAHSCETTYVYDFIPLIERALGKIWLKSSRDMAEANTTTSSTNNQLRKNPSGNIRRVRSLSENKQSEVNLPNDILTNNQKSLILNISELVLNDTKDDVILVKRQAGLNNIGMVAWRLTICTPEYPLGRDIVVICNDISFQMGTFGTKEDALFFAASKHAREHKIPRFYFAANSGARIGLAEELRFAFQVAWINNDPFKGMDYLYLDEDTHKKHEKSVRATRREIKIDNKIEIRYILTDIIGESDDLGVENLSGSGLIAGETSQAYQDIFTLTFITGRCVGIGAYLARLGQRVIQKRTEPILLTGYNALNKLLGKKVYRSNTQLGGIDVMYQNGVSHLVANNDLDGVVQSLNWLSYIPKSRKSEMEYYKSNDEKLMHNITYNPNGSVNICIDSITRPVSFIPQKGIAYDPRCLITGCEETGTSGFCDKGSFMELLGGWSRSIVAGRAKLGGISIGVIAVETHTIENVIPADPAAVDAKEEVLPRAAQVWFPDSSYKTAQVMWDLAAEDLPLVIFANWRGFSGGMRDMFDEILKFGSYIVDSLRGIKQPVFVYLPPFSTLRGGAWVVVDSKINPDFVEMYAAASARGGVLETEGILDVKFRKAQVLSLAHKLDGQLKKLDEQKSSSSVTTTTSEDDEKNNINIVSLIEERERAVYPLFHQAAAAFCDLHDTPGRMVSKGVVKKCIPWEHSRRFFVHRLRSSLHEYAIARDLMEQTCVLGNKDNQFSLLKARETVHQWYNDYKKSNEMQTDSDELTFEDRMFTQWVLSNRNQIEEKVKAVRKDALKNIGNNVQNELIELLQQYSKEDIQNIMSKAGITN